MLKKNNLLKTETTACDNAISADSIHRLGLGMLVLVLNTLLVPYALVFLVYGIFGLPTNSDGNGYYIFMLALNEISAYLVPLIIFGAMFGRECKKYVPNKEYKKKHADFIILFLAGIGAGSLGTLITRLVNALIDSVFHTGKIADAFENSMPENGVCFAAFSVCICVIAPICEELIFRRFLLIPLRKLGDFPAILLSGLVFGLYHANFDQFAYATLVGIFYALIAIRRNSILPTVALHALNNFIVTNVSYAPFENGFTSAMSVVSSLMFPIGLLAIVAAAIMGLLKLKKAENEPNGKEIIKLILKSPAFMIGFLAMFAAFFI